jgi:carbon storage regulator
MLVLSRKKGESIIIGDQIEVVVLGAEGDTLKIGVRAPKHIEVYRKEIYEAIKDENRKATHQNIHPVDISKLLRKKE